MNFPFLKDCANLCSDIKDEDDEQSVVWPSPQGGTSASGSTNRFMNLDADELMYVLIFTF